MFIEVDVFLYILNRSSWIYLNAWFNALKRIEYIHFPRWKNFKDYSDWCLEKDKPLDPIPKAILEKNYVFGESFKQMDNRIKFKEKVKDCNKDIK